MHYENNSADLTLAATLTIPNGKGPFPAVLLITGSSPQDRDYDGIIAGAHAGPLTHIFAAFTLDIQATEADPASYIPSAKLPAIESTVLSTCDALDGLKDGVIDDPRKCHFDPGTLLCKGADSLAEG